MYFAKEGRKDYLDFIKNIPIQTLLFFVGTLFIHGGLPGHPTAMKVAVGVVLCLMGVGAALASSSLFVDSLRENLIEPERKRALEKYPSIQGSFRARCTQLVKHWWFRKQSLIQVLAAVLVIDLAFSVAVVSALFSAFNALHINLMSQH